MTGAAPAPLVRVEELASHSGGDEPGGDEPAVADDDAGHQSSHPHRQPHPGRGGTTPGCRAPATRSLVAEDLRPGILDRHGPVALGRHGVPGRAITEREEEILKLVAEGHSSKEIAGMLVISVKTVERHRANLLQKPGLRDRLELTRYAIRAGLIEP